MLLPLLLNLEIVGPPPPPPPPSATVTASISLTITAIDYAPAILATDYAPTGVFGTSTSNIVVISIEPPE